MANIINHTITELNELLKKDEISVKELVQEYIDRIQAFDQGTNGLNSVLEINPEALQIAQKLDETKKNKRSLLWGIPIMLKDNIDTGDQMHTSAGSLALANSYAKEDAVIVKSLRSKGSVLLGKTNMTEFANYMTENMPAGYSSRGGCVLSPYNRNESPSGSSTGSAVAVAADFCAASIGTDTSGSIVSPAIANGLVGFRPSIGALSQKGIIPISFTLDAAGPMTRTVNDSAIIYSELTDRKNPLEKMKKSKELTIGVVQIDKEDLSDEEKKKGETILHELEKAGIHIKAVTLPTFTKDHINRIQRYEFKHGLNRYLDSLPEHFPIRSLKDIIEFNLEHGELALPFGQTLLIDAYENTSGNLEEEEYLQLLKLREETKVLLNEQLKEINALIMMKEHVILQYVGLPSITIPRGLKNDGMPFGFFVTAPTDEALLKHAYELEQLVGHRELPKLGN